MTTEAGKRRKGRDVGPMLMSLAKLSFGFRFASHLDRSKSQNTQVAYYFPKLPPHHSYINFVLLRNVIYKVPEVLSLSTSIA